jgi:hypothetical protein
VQTGLAAFSPIWRFPVTARMIRHDVLAVIRELVILMPIAAAVWWLRSRSRAGPAARSR